MMKIKKRMATFVIAGCMFASGVPVYAAATVTDAEGKIYAYMIEDEQTGESDAIDDYSFSFLDEVEDSGKTYVLNHVEYDVTNAYQEQYGDTEIPETIVKREEHIKDKDDYKPSNNVLTQNGFQYEYTDTAFQESEDSVEKPIDLQKYMDSDYTTGDLESIDKPSTLPYEYKGKTYTLTYDHAEKIYDGWRSGYTVTGTIYDYDAATIRIGNIEVEPAQFTDLSIDDLQAYATAQGYSSDMYRLSKACFTGEPYTAGGVMCRDYILSADVYVRQYRMYYSLHDTEKEQQYIAENTYELSHDDTETLEALKNTFTVHATAYYDQVEQKRGFLSTPAKVAIAFGVVIVLALIAALIIYMMKGGRKSTDYRSRRDSKRDYKNL